MKITKQVTEDIELQFPVYRKSNVHFWACFSEKEIYKVNTLEGHVGIEQSFIDSAFANFTTDSTQEEFEQAFMTVSNRFRLAVFPSTETVTTKTNGVFTEQIIEPKKD